MKKYWEVYFITKNGFNDVIGCKNKFEAVKEAKRLAKDNNMDWVEVRAHNGEELLDDTEMIIKK